MTNNKEQQKHLIRQLQYRLKRQGMLELDAWLSPLQQALEAGDPEVIQAIKIIMNYEVPELLDLQTGRENIPEELKPWLGS